MTRAIMLHEKDNVAVAVDDCAKAVTIMVQTPALTQPFEVMTAEAIQFGHKIALTSIDKGEIVIKYGRPIGRATANLITGGLIGVHNIEGLRGRGDLKNEGDDVNAFYRVSTSRK